MAKNDINKANENDYCNHFSMRIDKASGKRKLSNRNRNCEEYD